MRLIITLALVALFGGGCDFLSSSSRNSVVLGEVFWVDEGKTVRIDRSGPLLTFDAVQEESRCPTGVECVWAGRATASLRLLSRSGAESFTLTIPGLVDTPYEDNESEIAGGYEFKLLELNPYPDADQADGKPGYQAVLRVEQHNSER